ncbi:MAG: hypothetical protein LBD37_08805 [Treponema sp.]|jgi:hypothetical protein|nr:hypothetical protein [Treponema sp.]
MGRYSYLALLIWLCLACHPKAEPLAQREAESRLEPALRSLPAEPAKRLERPAAAPSAQSVQWRPVPDPNSEPRKRTHSKPAAAEPEPPKPAPPPAVKKETPAPPKAESPAEPAFDPQTISQEVYDTAKFDAQKLIGSLNMIIRAKDYNAWVKNLADDYFRSISAPGYLKKISESPALKSRKIRITSPRDYFNYVVVPSRAEDQVDDIEFVSPSRIKAYRITPQGQRLRLYDLEKIGNNWKIID